MGLLTCQVDEDLQTHGALKGLSSIAVKYKTIRSHYAGPRYHRETLVWK